MLQNEIKRVLLSLSNGALQKQELEQSLGFSIPEILFKKQLVTRPDKRGYVKLTMRGESALSFLESVREMSTLEVDLERTLTTLEKMEEELINVGFYDVITSPNNLAEQLGISEEEARRRLNELSRRMYVLKLYDEQGNIVGYRSRIAEITRLISCLKQRFSEDDVYEAPNLVSSVKLRIKDRYVARRSKPVEDLMATLEGYVIEKFKQSWDTVKSIIFNWLEYAGIERVSDFQKRATLEIFNILQRLYVKDLERDSIALVAETGAGKTEAYLLPFIIHLLLRKIGGDHSKKTRLIVIYPRVALSLNQLARFTKYSYQIKMINKDIEIFVGIDNESIPYTYGRLIGDQYKYKDYWYVSNKRAYFKRFLCPVLENISDVKFECCSQVYYDEEENKVLCGENHELPVRLFKKEVYGSNPDTDIIIMTPNTLMRRLFENEFIQFLERTDILVLALDECHLYSGLPGANAALVFRRLLRLIEEMGIRVIILGISATMASAEEFFKELTGLRPQIIKPEESELERKSVEYYLIIKPEMVSLKRARLHISDQEEEETEEELKPIKPLSTMIQTVMCVMHNMRRTQLKNKGLGFVDSIDTLHRWRRAQQDAEDRRLFELRTKKDERCKRCEDGPIISCPTFRVGECWWYAKFDKLSYRLLEPIKLDVYYSEKREELKDLDCILSTSALEVGYDDPKLIAFFQYKAPRSIISFAQRKGRVARSPDDRPINVLVLSPYSSRDNFVFVNDDHLLNSEFNEIPLNSENYFAQNVHAKAAIVDYVSYKNPNVKITYETWVDNIQPVILNFLQMDRDKIKKWIGKVASIYDSNDKLCEMLIEQVEEKLKHER